jgi:hypothetical protein
MTAVSLAAAGLKHEEHGEMISLLQNIDEFMSVDRETETTIHSVHGCLREGDATSHLQHFRASTPRPSILFIIHQRHTKIRLMCPLLQNQP